VIQIGPEGLAAGVFMWGVRTGLARAPGFLYSHVAYAYAPGRLHRAVPRHQTGHATFRRHVAPRNQTRWLRIIARKDGAEVKLYSRPGNDFTWRFPLSPRRSPVCVRDPASSTARLACGDDGVASFDRIRYRLQDADVFLYAFDLMELNGDDMRRDPLEVRKSTLRSVLAKAGPACGSTSTWEGDGPTVFTHACKMALEGRSARTRLIARGGRLIGSR